MENEFIKALNAYILKVNLKKGSSVPKVTRKKGKTSLHRLDITPLAYGHHFEGIGIMPEFKVKEDLFYNPDNGYFAFADFEEYDLSYIRMDSTDEIALLDSAHQLELHCAKNFTDFMRAMTAVVKFYMSQLDVAKPYQEPDCKRICKTCATLAGGEKYARFYYILLGCRIDKDSIVHPIEN